MKTHIKTFFIFAAIVASFILFTDGANATSHLSPCTRNPGGDVLIDSSCAFPELVDGVDNGHLTIDGPSGTTLTINANQTLVWNPGGFEVRLTNGSIVINDTGELRKNYLWMEDKDSDGSPATLTQVGSQTQPTSPLHERRHTMSSLSTTDCDDNDPGRPPCYAEGYYYGQSYYQSYYYGQGYYYTQGYYQSYYYTQGYYYSQNYYEGYYYGQWYYYAEMYYYGQWYYYAQGYYQGYYYSQGGYCLIWGPYGWGGCGCC
ncbi:MAG: hypothetical protein WDZ40_01500 [Candidatus Spechtbacterales bacterium]